MIWLGLWSLEFCISTVLPSSVRVALTGGANRFAPSPLYTRYSFLTISIHGLNGEHLNRLEEHVQYKMDEFKGEFDCYNGSTPGPTQDGGHDWVSPTVSGKGATGNISDVPGTGVERAARWFSGIGSGGPAG